MKKKKYLNKKNQFKYQKFLACLKTYDDFKNMVEEKVSWEFRLENIDETGNYFLEEKNSNELMSKDRGVARI